MAPPPESMPNRLTSCGVLLVRGEPIDSFLLMKHADRWDLPKGHIETGETPLACALRELEEETGIGAADVKIDAKFRFETSYEVRYKKYDFAPCPKTTIIFLGRLLSPAEIHVSEHIDFAWQAWPPAGPIQAETIDPLLEKLAAHLA